MIKSYSRFPQILLEITYNRILCFDVIFPLESCGRKGSVKRQFWRKMWGKKKKEMKNKGKIILLCNTFQTWISHIPFKLHYMRKNSLRVFFSTYNLSISLSVGLKAKEQNKKDCIQITDKFLSNWTLACFFLKSYLCKCKGWFLGSRGVMRQQFGKHSGKCS